MYKLRELKKEDIIDINKWRNNRELISYLGAPYRYINIDVDYAWYEDYLKIRNNTIRCAIVECSNVEKILGLVSLTNVNRMDHSAVFHIMIGDMDKRGKGIGFYATTEMLKHAFLDINLNRVELTALENNMRALKMYEKVGFKREGMKREAIYKEGKFINVIMMSLLRNEYFDNYRSKIK